MALGCLRRRDDDERQFKSPQSSNTVSLRRNSLFSEICSPWRVTPFLCQNAPFPPKSNKTAPAAKPCYLKNWTPYKLLKCYLRFIYVKTLKMWSPWSLGFSSGTNFMCFKFCLRLSNHFYYVRNVPFLGFW